ncbi:MAG TPA: TolC family protein, partial [Polyangiales bacterium]|nr:TolC family protein [Polyangiales bacterium]
ASTRLEQIVLHASTAARASAEQGLVSGLDAEVAELNTLKLTEERIRATGVAKAALAALLTLLGRDLATETAIVGNLTPLEHVNTVQLDQVERIVAERPEVARLKQLKQSYEAARSALERSRVPNITLSLIAQRDGFGEQVLGGGIAVPLPLPYPVGRTFHGELVENAALTRQVELESELLQRNLRLELVAGWQAHAAGKAQAALYTDERLERAMRSFEQLAQALRTGTIPISDAVIAQQTLVEFLRAHIRAKLEVCLASVELARSAGLPLWGDDL